MLQGGAAFIAIKGALRLYFKQYQYLNQAKRQVSNFEDTTPENVSSIATQTAHINDNSQ